MYIQCVCVPIYIYTNICNREVGESKERGGGDWMKKERRKDGRGRRKEESVINVDYLHGDNLGDVKVNYVPCKMFYIIDM